MKIAPYDSSADGAASVSETSLVGFQVGDVSYAIDIHRVREIIVPMPTLALPHVPASVVGVVDHRGVVVPVIDLRLRFSVPREPRRTMRWIIATRGDRLCGLVVDRVTEVFTASADARRDVPEIAAGKQVRGITAAYSHRDGLIFVLDPDVLTAVTDELELPGIEALRGADGGV
jgi:purine-binding chemotaxis protein CheW